MAVKIRLSRCGKIHQPFYRIVAVDSRKKRDGKCIENLGTYDPLANKYVQFHVERIKAWIDQGAQMSDSAARLYKNYLKAQQNAPAA